MLEQDFPFASIKFAGCWASDKAMSCYLQEAEAASTLLSFSKSSQCRLNVFGVLSHSQAAMKEGDTFELFVPPELAYGSSVAPVLTFHFDKM